MLLAIVSTIVRNDAPRSMDAGMLSFVLLPTIMREKCGITSPTHPICPDDATDAAVRRVEAVIAARRSSDVFTPMLLASSSERERRFILHDMSRIGMDAMIATVNTRMRSELLNEERDPMRKYVIAGRVSSVSATSLIKLVELEKRLLTIIPQSIRVSVSLFFILEEIPIIRSRESIPKRKAEILTAMYPAPLRSARDAPNAEALELPSTSWLAIGLLNTCCRSSPESAREDPMMKERKTDVEHHGLSLVRPCLRDVDNPREQNLHQLDRPYGIASDLE